MFKTFIYGSLLLLLSGCYSMPTDEDFCVVPTTNNKDIIKDTTGQSDMPTLKY